MGWLQRQRDTVTAELYGRASRTCQPDLQQFDVSFSQVGSESFTFTVQRERVHAGSFDIVATCELLPAEVVGETVALAVEFQAVIHRTSLLGIESACLHCVALDMSASLRCLTKSDLAIGAVVERFRFEEPRSDPPQLFPRRPTVQASAVKQARARMPDPPPAVKKTDLAERLRLLLMPPVDELLADPELGLPAEPFKYQTEGIWWLMQRENALLADEMGLGKTMQAIVAARLLWKEKRISRILVVCPKTLIPTWQREFAMWWPFTPDYMRVCEGDRKWFLKLATKNLIVKIINYEALAREAEWVESERFSHDLIIIDEAQRIKNPESHSAKAVKALKSERRWALTGTPLENKIDDVISIFGFVMPELLGNDDPEYVRKHISPYMLRRTTEKVQPDLPSKIELPGIVDLSQAQREAYESAERDGVVKLNELGDTITVVHVFALITALRQICNVDVGSDESAKLELLLEDLEEIVESGRKALVFSQFTGERGITWLAGRLGAFKPLCLHGEVPQKQRDPLIQLFNTKPDNKVLLLNYAVGGVGLNLQRANYVYLFDRWWNPAVEDQAVKRAHRLGQTDRVFVKRFYCKDTIEERILQKQREKRDLFRRVIDDASLSDDSMGLAPDEVFGLFENLKVRPKQWKREPQGTAIVLDNLDPRQFEELVARVYEKQGYKATVTGKSHDGGIDIKATRITDSAREFVVIQCKHQAATVGREVLQQLWGVVHSNSAITRGDFVTTSRFSLHAREFAADKRLTLIDRTELERLIVAYKVAIPTDRIVNTDQPPR